LGKLRRSGMLDEDAHGEPEPPAPALGREPRSARDLRGDIPDFARWKAPAGGERGESSARAAEAGGEALPPMWEATVDAPRSTLDGDWPAACETANDETDAPLDETPSPAAIDLTWATASNGTSGAWIVLLLAACCWWLVASGHGAALQGSPMNSSPRPLRSDLSRAFPPLAKGGSGGVILAQPATACAGALGRFVSRGHSALLQANASPTHDARGVRHHPALPPLRKGRKFFETGATEPAMRERRLHSTRADSSTTHPEGPFPADFSSTRQGAAAADKQIEPAAATATAVPRSNHEHRTMNDEALARNKAKVICAGRAASADQLTVAPPTANTRGASDQTGKQRPKRCKPAARNKATAIWHDSAESSGQPGSVRMRQSGNSALRNLSTELGDVPVAIHKEGTKPGIAQSCLFLDSCIPQIVLTAFG